MAYKALIVDLDGTAIPHLEHGMPRPRVVAAVKKLQKHMAVCVSTSRPAFMAAPVIEALGITGPCAVNDSTQIYDPVTKKVIETLYLPKHQINPIKDILLRFKLPFMVNDGINEHMYSGGDLPATLSVLAVPDITGEVADNLIKEVQKLEGLAVMKVPAFKKGFVWVSVTNPQATKLHSVIAIAKRLSIDTKDIVGIGDGYNDFPLLEACGLKIAMRNAVDELKDIADFIAPSVDDDGVAVVIEKLLLPLVQ